MLYNLLLYVYASVLNHFHQFLVLKVIACSGPIFIMLFLVKKHPKFLCFFFVYGDALCPSQQLWSCQDVLYHISNNINVAHLQRGFVCK